MKRRSFLKSVLGCLGFVFLPKSKAKSKKWTEPVTAAMPLTDDFAAVTIRPLLPKYETYEEAVQEVDLAVKEHNQKVYEFIKAKFLKC